MAIPWATPDTKRLQIKAFSIASTGKVRQLPLVFPFPTPMTLRLGTRSLCRAFGLQSPRSRSHSIQQLPGDYSVVLPKEPFVWGVSHIIPRPVPIHIRRPPYIKGDRPTVNDLNHREVYEGDGRVALGSPEEMSLRKAALLARDALNYASALVKVATSFILAAAYLILTTPR